LTGKSPPMLNVEVSLGDVADKSVAALPAKSAAPPVRVVRRNSRRLMPLVTRSSLAPKGFSFIAEAYVHMRSFHEASFSAAPRMRLRLDRNPICRIHRLRLQLQLTILQRKGRSPRLQTFMWKGLRPTAHASGVCSPELIRLHPCLPRRSRWTKAGNPR